jgi:small subunit ribosomal protein S8
MSGVNLSIAETLKKAGYISGYEVVKGEKKTHSMLKIYLKYSPASKEGIIKNIQRVSKPGRRVYANSRKIPTVLNGYGIAIVSTSRGVLTDKEARGLNVGGEILCNVW